jgi:hypothetical protein
MVWTHDQGDTMNVAALAFPADDLVGWERAL